MGEARPEHVESGLVPDGGWVVEVGCRGWLPGSREGSHLPPSGAPLVRSSVAWLWGPHSMLPSGRSSREFWRVADEESIWRPQEVANGCDPWATRDWGKQAEALCSRVLLSPESKITKFRITWVLWDFIHV